MQTFDKHESASGKQGTLPFDLTAGWVSLQIIILFVATFALYASSLNDPFVFDDIDFFVGPESVAKQIHRYFNFDLRWLSYSTFNWTIHWFGLDLFWLRLGNVLLHAANSITLYFLLRRIFQATLSDYYASNDLSPSLGWYAFFCALIFALHPISVYGVAYLIERSILMANLFVLLMLLAYTEGLLRGGWYWMLAASLFFFAAVYSKEHSITALGVALAITVLIRKPSLGLLRQIAPFYILSALIALTVLSSFKGILGHSYEPNAAGILNLSATKQGLAELPHTQLFSVLTQSSLYFKYLWLWLRAVAVAGSSLDVGGYARAVCKFILQLAVYFGGGCIFSLSLHRHLAIITTGKPRIIGVCPDIPMDNVSDRIVCRSYSGTLRPIQKLFVGSRIVRRSSDDVQKIPAWKGFRSTQLG